MTELRPDPVPTDAEPSKWTPAAIRDLGPVTDVPTAGAILGLSRSVAYELARTRQFPIPILRVGRRYRVPVAALLAVLHLPAEPPKPVPDLPPTGQSSVHPPAKPPASPRPRT